MPTTPNSPNTSVKHRTGPEPVVEPTHRTSTKNTGVSTISTARPSPLPNPCQVACRSRSSTAKPSRSAPAVGKPSLRPNPLVNRIRNLWARFSAGQTGAGILPENADGKVRTAPQAGTHARWRRRSSRSTTASDAAGAAARVLRRAPAGAGPGSDAGVEPREQQQREAPRRRRARARCPRSCTWGPARRPRAARSTPTGSRPCAAGRARVASSRWCRWPASAWCQCWRVHEPADEREHDVEDRHAEDDHRDQRGARRRRTCCPRTRSRCARRS